MKTPEQNRLILSKIDKVKSIIQDSEYAEAVFILSSVLGKQEYYKYTLDTLYEIPYTTITLQNGKQKSVHYVEDVIKEMSNLKKQLGELGYTYMKGELIKSPEKEKQIKK